MTGVLEISAEQYHNDAVADVPTLSASVAKLLVSHSPLHAWTQHPKLNPNYKRVEDDKFSLGTAAHALLLEGRDAVEVIYEDSYRTNDAKAAKKTAIDAGRIPMLVDQWTNVQAMVAAIREQLPGLDVDPPVLAAGKPEVPIVWDEGGVKCRALVDWLHDTSVAIDDVKTTKASANPESWTRTMYGFQGDIQVAFNLAAVKAATGVEPDFRFVVAEVEPPYAVSVVSLAPQALALARDRMEYALKLWKRCLTTGIWPGYSRRVHFVETPGYLEFQWLEKEAREAA